MFFLTDFTHSRVSPRLIPGKATILAVFLWVSEGSCDGDNPGNKRGGVTGSLSKGSPSIDNIILRQVSQEDPD